MQFNGIDIINYINLYIEEVEKNLYVSIRGSLNRIIVQIDVENSKIRTPQQFERVFPTTFLETLNKHIKSSMFSYLESKLIINNSEVRKVLFFDENSRTIKIRKQDLVADIIKKVCLNMINTAINNTDDKDVISWLVNKKQLINYENQKTKKQNDFINNCADLIIYISKNILHTDESV